MMKDRISPIPFPPSEDEIFRRIGNLQAAMAVQELDYYLCFSPDNIFYLTNFANFLHERPFILLVPSTGTPVFLMPRLEDPHVRSRAVGKLAYLSYAEFPAPPGQGWSDRLKDVLKETHRVGLETGCPLGVTKEVPGTASVVDLVDDLRMIKSEYEIRRIAYTCDLLCKGHAWLLGGARPGRMIAELHTKIAGRLTKRLLLDNPNSNLINTKFAAIAQPPGISHDPHNFTDVFMAFSQGGPHVSLASGLANGYGGEVERTFFINTVPEKAKAPFHDMLEARALAYEMTVPGNLMSEVDRSVTELLTSRGYGRHLLHRTGHSFGVTNHEAPFLAQGYEREIQPNMVFSIEPGIYIEGLGGFRFSDTVLVTEKGNRKLTHAPEMLEDLVLDGSLSLMDTAKSLVMKAMAKSAFRV